MKICKYCNMCKRVYDRGVARYFKRKLYYCTEKEEITEQKNGCEKWEQRKIEYDLSARRFDEAENDIKFLLELLNDE